MFHQEITIPVNKDSRNFEQRRKDMFTTLESNCTTQSSTNKSLVTKDNFRNDNNWDMEVHDWVNKSRGSWDEEINRIKRSMFSLEPTDGFDDSFDKDSSQHTTSSFSQKVMSTITTTTTKDGKAITESSKSMHASSTAGAPPLPIERSHFDQRSLCGTDYFKDAYEVSDDKQVHFKVRLDTADFKPEDIKIIAQDNQVTITARKEIVTSNEKSFREFSKTISVPPSVDIKKFQCQQTKDGILILEAPIKQHENLAITLKDGLGIKAVSDEHSKFSNSLVTVTGKAGPVVIDDIVYGKKIHLEITVDHDYEPSDFSVHTQLNQIHIKGRHETKTANSSSFKEFSRYYEVPETLDPMSVSFHLLNGTLVVEAPLLKTV